MQPKDSLAYLRHVRDCCAQIARCGELREDAQIPESIILDAICRNLEIIGEAASKLDADFRAAHPEIPWRQMIAVRNILIHNYDGVDTGIVWGLVDRDIPDLLKAIQRLLAE